MIGKKKKVAKILRGWAFTGNRLVQFQRDGRKRHESAHTRYRLISGALPQPLSLTPAGKRRASGSGRLVSGPTQLRPPPGRQRSAENRAAARCAGRCASLPSPRPPTPGSGCPRVGPGPRRGSGAHPNSWTPCLPPPAHRRRRRRRKMKEGWILPQEAGEDSCLPGKLSRMLGQSQSLRLTAGFCYFPPSLSSVLW